jgi:hypothetical protein
MIVCNGCGKRKKIQNPNRPNWQCSTCSKKRQGGKVEIQCFDCRKTIEVGKSKINVSDYYICGTCYKHHATASIDIFREPAQILIRKFNAAGEMHGFDIRFPTDEQKESLERAKTLRDCGIAQMRVSKKIEQGEKLNPHLN